MGSYRDGAPIRLSLSLALRPSLSEEDVDRYLDAYVSSNMVT